MFFGFLGFGLLGSPVAVSHGGGILGGLITVLLTNKIRRSTIEWTDRGWVEDQPQTATFLRRNLRAFVRQASPGTFCGWSSTRPRSKSPITN